MSNSRGLTRARPIKDDTFNTIHMGQFRQTRPQDADPTIERRARRRERMREMVDRGTTDLMRSTRLSMFLLMGTVAGAGATLAAADFDEPVVKHRHVSTPPVKNNTKATIDNSGAHKHSFITVNVPPDIPPKVLEQRAHEISERESLDPNNIQQLSTEADRALSYKLNDLVFSVDEKGSLTEQGTNACQDFVARLLNVKVSDIRVSKGTFGPEFRYEGETILTVSNLSFKSEGEITVQIRGNNFLQQTEYANFKVDGHGTATLPPVGSLHFADKISPGGLKISRSTSGNNQIIMFTSGGTEGGKSIISLTMDDAGNVIKARGNSR